MAICEYLFEDIKGSEDVRRLIVSELPDMKFFNLPEISWLFIKGSEDLVIQGKNVDTDKRYICTPNNIVPYQFPHLEITAKVGSIDGVRVGGREAISKYSDKEMTRVIIQPNTSNCATSDTPPGRVAYWETVLDIKYTDQQKL